MKLRNTLHRFRGVLMLGLAFTALVGIATASSVNADLVRRSNNATRLQELNPYMRPKVAAVVSDLERHGLKPLIDGAIFRTPAEQAALVRKGHSKVLYSYHNANTCDGRARPCSPKADSLAADIVDGQLFWSAGTPFWLKLASSAQSHDLDSGIYWGLSEARRKMLRDVIESKQWNAQPRLGWDTAHVQVRGLSLVQAKAGKRLVMVNGRKVIVSR
jgi:hypothetical protein